MTGSAGSERNAPWWSCSANHLQDKDISWRQCTPTWLQGHSSSVSTPWLFSQDLGYSLFTLASWFSIGFLLSSLFRNLVNSWLFSLAHLGIYENEEWSHWRWHHFEKTLGVLTGAYPWSLFVPPTTSSFSAWSSLLPYLWFNFTSWLGFFSVIHLLRTGWTWLPVSASPFVHTLQTLIFQNRAHQRPFTHL